ncbi:hypothetical protein U3516DRAFT_795861 [Neocallimastix sp. 'constans']|jgi:hypothetical protein
MASPLDKDSKSVTLQSYLTLALKKLIENDKYQILKITNQTSSRIDLENDDYDRFTLVYTILDTKFELTFLFDTNDLTTPPDLILEDNIGFSKECEKSDILNINTIISNWNIKDDNCIINLIQKLKDSFKEYNLNKALQLNTTRIDYEINSLLNVCENYDIMVIPQDAPVYEKVRFIVPVEKKPRDGVLNSDDPNNYIYGVLLVSDFIIDKPSREVASNSMEYIFSKKTKGVKRINKRLPKWELNKFLNEYMKETETNLDDAIVLKTSDNIRKEFLNALLNEFNDYILEYDALDYLYAAFYIKNPKDAPDLQYNSVVLFFYFNDDFPHHDPTITIIIPYHQRSPERSIRHDIKYHFNKKYFTETPKRYEEAAALFKNYILSNIPQFIREYKH